MARERRPWTEQDKEQLKYYWCIEKVSVPRLVHLLDRAHGSINTMIHKLGLPPRFEKVIPEAPQPTKAQLTLAARRDDIRTVHKYDPSQKRMIAISLPRIRALEHEVNI